MICAVLQSNELTTVLRKCGEPWNVSFCQMGMTKLIILSLIVGDFLQLALFPEYYKEVSMFKKIFQRLRYTKQILFDAEQIAESGVGIIAPAGLDAGGCR